jgi:hypothetical protein
MGRRPLRSSPAPGTSNVLSRQSRSLAIAAIVLITLLFPAGPATAEYRIQAFLMMSEQYNDNIYLTPLDKEFDYITKVVPSIGITYKAPLWDWNATFAYDYSYYARAAFQKDKTYNVNLTNETRVIQDLIFLAIRDTYSRVSLDLTRDFTQQSSFVNQTDQNILSANPYVMLHPGPRTSVNVGYIYQNIWYKDPNAIEKVDHLAYVEMGHALSPQLTTTIAARYSQNRNEIEDYKRGDLIAGMRYEYLDGSILYGKIGNIWFLTATAVSETQLFWNAGFEHQFPKFKFTFDTALNYVDDPQRVLRRVDSYTARIRREVERTSLGVTGSLQEYRNALTKHLESKSYSVGGTVNHEIATQSKIIADLTIQRLEDSVEDTYTDLYLSGVRYEYRGWENVTLAFGYRYTNSYSPDIYFNCYTNNQFIAEVKKAF